MTTHRSILLAVALVACADSAATPGAADLPGTTRGVNQGGAQDIARFRAIVAAGAVPTPATLDATGFLAEHAFDLPPATCGATICASTMLAVAPRFDRTNWTMGFVALSTAVDPAARPRRPLHLVVVVETSPTVLLTPGLRASVDRMFRALTADDRVTVVAAGATARVASRGATATEATLGLSEVLGAPQVALYEALALARAEARSLAGFAGDARVLLLTSGASNAGAGAGDPARVIALGEAMAREGVALSVVGVGATFDERVPMALGSIGAGTYAYAQDGADLGDILDGEARTTLFPLATDFTLRLVPARGYRVGRIYGARRAKVSGGAAVLESPALFVGSRAGSRDVAGGRRGGGGGLFVELIADPSTAGSVGRGAPAFTVEAAWREAEGGAAGSTSASQVNALAPGQNPDDSAWPSFSDEARAKVFMALNMYLALRAATDLFDAGDCARAQGVIDMMGTSVDAWRRRRSDPDIDADARLMESLRANLGRQCRAVDPVEPRDFGGGCFFI